MFQLNEIMGFFCASQDEEEGMKGGERKISNKKLNLENLHQRHTVTKEGRPEGTRKNKSSW